MKELNFLTIVKTFLLTLVNGCCVYGVLHTCPSDTWEFGNSCVQVHFNELDWDDARAQCRRLGGDLLEVRSSEMQLFVQKHLIATGRRPAGYWIGATDRDHEDNWQWVHGNKTMHFSNWNKGQGPGTTGFFFSDGSLEDCAMIRPDAGYKWHDGPCAGGFAFHYAFLCEFRCYVYGVLHTCPTDTWEFGYSCIQVHFNELDWDDARAYCRRFGGDLLEVRSSEMQLFVQDHLIGTGRKPAGYWIGATDRDHEDNWQWVHGDKTMHYSNWEKGQGPGQTGFFFSDGSLEDCAMIRPDAGYKWHDGPCAGGFAFHYAFLCEFQIVRISFATTKSTTSILMSTLKPTLSNNNQTTNVFTQPSFPTDSPIPTTSITTTASPATVVTPTPTTSSSPLPSVTSVPSSPVTSTEVPTSTSIPMPTTTTTADGVIIG